MDIELVVDCCCFGGKKAENGFGALVNEGAMPLVGADIEGGCSDELISGSSGGVEEKGNDGGGCFDCGKNWKGAVGGFGALP